MLGGSNNDFTRIVFTKAWLTSSCGSQFFTPFRENDWFTLELFQGKGKGMREVANNRHFSVQACDCGLSLNFFGNWESRMDSCHGIWKAHVSPHGKTLTPHTLWSTCPGLNQYTYSWLPGLFADYLHGRAGSKWESNNVRTIVFSSRQDCDEFRDQPKAERSNASMFPC